jgi:hypothetical protein
VRRYLAGLLARVERKDGWQVAEAIGERGPQGVQRLLNAAVWDAEAVRDDLRAYVLEHLGDAKSGVFVLDDSAFPKKGAALCGVAPQHCGAVGSVANCRVGVFLGYASRRGMAFLDRALYLPRARAGDRDRRAAAGVPDEVAFSTKPELAKGMVARAQAAGVSARWLARCAGVRGASRREGLTATPQGTAASWSRPRPSRARARATRRRSSARLSTRTALRPRATKCREPLPATRGSAAISLSISGFPNDKAPAPLGTAAGSPSRPPPP